MDYPHKPYEATEDGYYPQAYELVVFRFPEHMVSEGCDDGGAEASGCGGAEGKPAGDSLPDVEFCFLKGRPREGTDHMAKVLGVGGDRDRARSHNECNVRDEDRRDLKESRRETEENADSRGNRRDERRKMAIQMEGDQAQNRRSHYQTCSPTY